MTTDHGDTKATPRVDGPPDGPTAPDATGATTATALTDNPVGHAVETVGKSVGQAVGDIGAYIRHQRETAQVSLRQLARSAGVSNPYLSQVERGLRKPSAEILQQIARGLRISAEALYVRAGILDERPASAVTDAVLADPTLTERQKQILLDVYQSFRRESDPGDTGAIPATTDKE